ncbi:MAG TPA: HD domain-containing phosphohydrolase [Chloroflexota bacterium]|jgi:response regulator RpfG family c-di-GMP phosphodiesterase
MYAADKRVLCVDDEPNVLEGLRRTLRGQYRVTTAVGGAAGLEAIQHDGPFAVVVSDLRMPEMDGVAFLSRVRQLSPDTVRVLLTGQADLDAAIAAVNEGHIFRFLSKPCPQPTLLQALDAATEQYRLVTAERVLLEQTLYGSIKALTDILALAVPSAFGRAVRAKAHLSELAERAGIKGQWVVEVAAMLSQIGCVTIPLEAAGRIYGGHWLSAEEQAMAERLPLVAEGLIAGIPRLENVREILAYHRKRFDGSGEPHDSLCGDAIPWGARALAIVLDFDELQARGFSTGLALDTLRGRPGWYDPEILAAFAEMPSIRESDVDVFELPLKALEVGMMFAEDVKTTTGVLFIARGQEVSPTLLERIHNLPRIIEVVEPVHVAVRRDQIEATDALYAAIAYEEAS